MHTYRVNWQIDIEAKSPRKAAKKALKIQRNKHSIATVFDVARTKIVDGRLLAVTLYEEIDVLDQDAPEPI